MSGCSAGSTSDPRHPLLRDGPAITHGIARNGRFELHGLDPDSEVPVSFFEPKRKLGATVHFSGKSAGGEPIVVKLEPCATATARLVGPGGKPLAGYHDRELISMVVTPGEFSGVKARKTAPRSPIRCPEKHRPDQLLEGPSRPMPRAGSCSRR